MNIHEGEGLAISYDQVKYSLYEGIPVTSFLPFSSSFPPPCVELW